MNNIKPRSIPTEDYLDIRLTMSGVRMPSTEHPQYQIAFRLLLANTSERAVRLLGRKWMLRDATGQTRVIEADTVFNQRPLLQPGDIFAYTGNHSFTTKPAHMEIMFFGMNQAGLPFISPSFVFPQKAYRTAK